MNEKIYDNLREYAKRVEEFRNKGLLQTWNEVEVQKYLIEPLLTALLWDTTNPSFVRYQYSVTMGSETKKVDYALMSGGTPVCVVEAKAGELDEIVARQALSYALNLNVPWALITNGQKLCLYGAKFYTSENVMNALIMDIEISPDSIDTYLDCLKYLAKGTLDTEEVYDVFKTFNNRMALLTFLQSKKDILVKDVIAKWIEEQWDKGSVDVNLLNKSLEKVFGRVEKIMPSDGTGEKRPGPIRRSTVITTAGDWKHRPDLGKGIFEFKTDPTKRIDVSLSGPEVERQLEELGIKTITPDAFNGFCYRLRRIAGLVKSKKR